MPDGAELRHWGFEDEYGNRGIPSRLIRVREGQIVHTQLKSTKGPHTIHHHGIEPDAHNDGVGHTSFDVNTRYTYQRRAAEAGTNFYHCHVNTPLHVQMGLFGGLIVDPETGPGTLWTGGPVYDHERFWAGCAFDPTWARLDHHAGVDGADVGLNLLEPRYFLINDKGGAEALEDPDVAVRATTGQTVLMRLFNATYHPQRWSWDTDVECVCSDGRAFDEGYALREIVMAPAERYGTRRGAVVVVRAPRQGRDAALDHGPRARRRRPARHRHRRAAARPARTGAAARPAVSGAARARPRRRAGSGRRRARTEGRGQGREGGEAEGHAQGAPQAAQEEEAAGAEEEAARRQEEEAGREEAAPLSAGSGRGRAQVNLARAPARCAHHPPAPRPAAGRRRFQPSGRPAARPRDPRGRAARRGRGRPRASAEASERPRALQGGEEGARGWARGRHGVQAGSARRVSCSSGGQPRRMDRDVDPIPSTAQPSCGRPSARMPATLRPSISTSFGHLIAAPGPATSATASPRRAAAAARVAQDERQHERAPRRADHVRPRRPRPAFFSRPSRTSRAARPRRPERLRGRWSTWSRAGAGAGGRAGSPVAARARAMWTSASRRGPRCHSARAAVDGERQRCPRRSRRAGARRAETSANVVA